MNKAKCVYAADLDSDGDRDVLTGSTNDDKISWHENLGSGVFGTQKVITTLADGAESLYATDLDSDGDTDVLSASEYDDKIAWYENLPGAIDINDRRGEIKEVITLSSNIPNPFRSNTLIKYQLLVDSKMIVKIFDITGQEVAILLNDDIKAGYHKVVWYASSCNPGPYYYLIKVKIISGEEVEKVMRIVLLK